MMLMLSLLSLLAVACCSELEVMNQWNLLDVVLPPDLPPEQYIPENNVFTGMEVGWGRVFLAVPRLRSGVAATLTWIPRADLTAGGIGSSPVLQPYPSWEWHSSRANCSGLISVYRIRADRCDRLWVLDSGILASLETYTPVCPPKLHVFDMRTDTLLRSFLFPDETLRPNTLLTNLVMDEFGPGCDDMFLYISDTANPGLIVMDVKRDTAWRVTHTTMFPHPEQSTYKVAGESFTLMDGVVGLALSPRSSQRVLYYQPLASTSMFSVPTAALKVPPKRGARENTLPVSLVGYKSSQSAVLAVNPEDGAIFFSPLTETALTSWQPHTEVNLLITFSPETLQFASDLRFAERNTNNIWMVSSRFQKFFRQTWNPNEVNLRVLRLNQQPLYNNSLVYFN